MSSKHDEAPALSAMLPDLRADRHADLPDPSLSASVDGVITNRVRVRPKKKRGPARKQFTAASAGTALARYRADPSVRGQDTAKLCISMPVAELAALDAMAERTQMARSFFIRQAIKHFIVKVAPESPGGSR